LCKTIVAVNTHCPHNRFDDPTDSKFYFLVVVRCRAHGSESFIDQQLDRPIEAPHTWSIFCVCLLRILQQYTTKLDMDKVTRVVHAFGKGKIGKKNFNFRLAAEEDNDALTGFSHNCMHL
jgi:hypothetical protein